MSGLSPKCFCELAPDPAILCRWSKSHDLMVQGGLTLEMICKSVAKANTQLRDGALPFFQLLEVLAQAPIPCHWLFSLAQDLPLDRCSCICSFRCSYHYSDIRPCSCHCRSIAFRC